MRYTPFLWQGLSCGGGIVMGKLIFGEGTLQNTISEIVIKEVVKEVPVEVIKEVVKEVPIYINSESEIVVKEVIKEVPVEVVKYVDREVIVEKVKAVEVKVVDQALTEKLQQVLVESQKLEEINRKMEKEIKILEQSHLVLKEDLRQKTKLLLVGLLGLLGLVLFK